MDCWFLQLCLFFRLSGGKLSTYTILIFRNVCFAEFTIGHFYILLFSCAAGVSGIETVFVRQGDSVILHTGVAKLKPSEMLQWRFGSTIIAEIPLHELIFHNNGFGNRLGLNEETWSLTIFNVSKEYSGVYTVDIFTPKLDLVEAIIEPVLNKSFNVIVSGITDSFLYSVHDCKLDDKMTYETCFLDPLSMPVITRTSDCSSERSSVLKCVLSCSVMNVTCATLSWYKENSLHSSVDFPITTPRPTTDNEYRRRKRSYDVVANPNSNQVNITLSLPLDVEYQDTDTYTCVVSNSSHNQTQHLHIQHFCRECSGWSNSDVISLFNNMNINNIQPCIDTGPMPPLYLLALIPAVLVLFSVGIFLCWKYGKGRQDGEY